MSSPSFFIRWLARLGVRGERGADPLTPWSLAEQLPAVSQANWQQRDRHSFASVRCFPGPYVLAWLGLTLTPFSTHFRSGEVTHYQCREAFGEMNK